MTKHFSKQELARCFRETGRCSECRLTQPAMKLPYGIEDNLEGLAKEVLEPVRERLGKPIVVNSGFRCPIHNRAVGGATGSQHMKGEAADLRFQDSSCKIQDLAMAIVDGGKWDQLILYPTFVHVSWKRQGGNRRQILRKTQKGYENVNINELK